MLRSTVIQILDNYHHSLHAVGIYTETHRALIAWGLVGKHRGLLTVLLSHGQEIISMYLNPWQTHVYRVTSYSFNGSIDCVTNCFFPLTMGASW